METCDVLIVGGGPAGSSCARALCAAGRDVRVLDKAAFPRDKVCAGWITPAVVAELEIDTQDYAQGRVFQPITGFLTSRLGGPEVRTDYARPVSYGIRRCEFDHYLLARSGAQLQLGEALDTLDRDGDHWVVNGQYRTPLLVGAGGHFCPVARLTTETPDEGEAVVLAQEIEFEMSEPQLATCRVAGEVPELFFCPDLKGYGWCFRKGNFLNIGLGRESERGLSEHVQAFREFLQSAGKISRDVPAKFHGHAYRLYQRAPRRMLHDRVLLIGDAAGLAYPQSGEGIRPAIESGLLAAAAICEAAGDCGGDVLSRLQARLIARFGPRRPANGSANLLPGGWKSFVAGKLLATRWFTRHVLLDRWFLHVHQPPLHAPACNLRSCESL